MSSRNAVTRLSMSGEASPLYKRQSGFSLIELMVALVVGLIIVLAAGGLLVSNLNTSQQVSWLRDKQAAVTVAVDVLARDIRRAQSVALEDGGSGLEVTVSNSGDSSECNPGDRLLKTYWVGVSSADNSKFVLNVDVDPQDECDASSYQEPIVAGFAGEGESGIVFNDAAGDGIIWEITLRLQESRFGPSGEAPEVLTFNVVNRSSAVQKATPSSGQ